MVLGDVVILCMFLLTLRKIVPREQLGYNNTASCRSVTVSSQHNIPSSQACCCKNKLLKNCHNQKTTLAHITIVDIRHF